MRETFALIRADLWRAKQFLGVGRPDKITLREILGLYGHHPQTWAVTLYRLAAGLKKRRVLFLPRLISRHVHLGYGLEIGLDMPVGGGLFIAHCQGNVIYAKAIGENATFIHAVTLGMRNEVAFPRLGNDVFVGAGARILGNVIIGDGARIGANAVVIEDVPAGATAVGVPAKVRGAADATKLRKEGEPANAQLEQSAETASINTGE
ncbi:MAG TPA: hypothetical protein VFW40_00745 [Capsulimonadaceae bacterium]|nr:hypothetical protein [Capsulimonadaceae bacterium]